MLGKLWEVRSRLYRRQINTKYSFESSWGDLQDLHAFAPFAPLESKRKTTKSHFFKVAARGKNTSRRKEQQATHTTGRRRRIRLHRSDPIFLAKIRLTVLLFQKWIWKSQFCMQIFHVYAQFWWNFVGILRIFSATGKQYGDLQNLFPNFTNNINIPWNFRNRINY